MSDSEGDFSDELLELAGATEKKRKRRQSSAKNGAKRRKAEMDSGSEHDQEAPESEEDEEEHNPYPLEGKYIDDADRLRLMEMPEIQREELLAQRLEEMQRIQDKRNLDQMLKAQQGSEGDSVARAAKRQHVVRGATKEKSRKLDELKAKRRAKDDNKRTRTSPKRDRSSSPMDMETSSGEEEDGQISKFEQEEEKELKLLGKAHPDDEKMTVEDLQKATLTRDLLAKHCLAPWFEDYVKGAWVRYLIGQDTNSQPIYRICEIENLAVNLVKPYKINDQYSDQEFELKHGKSVKSFPMDKVSNSPYSQREYDRLVRVYEAEHIKLPSKRQLVKKAEQLTRLANQPLTDKDITAILARKTQMMPRQQSSMSLAMERSRLNQMRTLAIRRNDTDQVESLDQKIAELTALMPVEVKNDDVQDVNDMLAKVNERNRKANLEAVRKAELAEVERKRRERKLAASGTGTPIPSDPSARLKTVPRLFASRPGTPSMNGKSPMPESQQGTPRTLSPLPATTATPGSAKGKPKSDFESRVLENIEIDLGDF
ncbi:plus-3-domain-containing protein [Dentipellis sp. KUC8613]|nr:plus-3-domain-containing protein [Dentipellis sp. KUC8613]